MRFLVQNKSIIKQINSVILKDRDNFPNLVEFDAALGLYDVIDGCPRFRMSGFCIDEDLD